MGFIVGLDGSFDNTYAMGKLHSRKEGKDESMKFYVTNENISP
jgi:hypothetical protein